MGHALMAVTGHDVERSVTGCASFGNPAMEYYCATGVFMEYFESPERAALAHEGLHAPCDRYTRFPAACYRYTARRMLAASRGNVAGVAAECMKLPRARRLGCFHGLGSAAIKPIADDPKLLAAVCRHGTADDQAVCIEGAIEKVADLDRSRALGACASLNGRHEDICTAAASGGMYRLNKPTMRLYHDP